MKNKKFSISILISIFLAITFLILSFLYYIISYSKNLNNFKKDIEANNYKEAYYHFNLGKDSYLLKENFIKDSKNIILDKFYKLEENYNNKNLSEEKTIEEINNLLSLNDSIDEIIAFKNNMPIIKNSENNFNEGVLYLENKDYINALNSFQKVNEISDYKNKASEYEEICLQKIREPILDEINNYISNKEYSEGIKYLNSKKEITQKDLKLQEKKQELENLRLEHLKNYSDKQISKSTKQTAPLKEYYKKLSENTINQFNIESDTENLIFVNICDQKTYIYTGEKNNWSLDKTFVCSTGIEGQETIIGEFKVQDRDTWFFSPKYGQGGKYYVQFMGNYLFHSIPFASDMNTILDDTLGEPSSHGCIRLSVDDSKWIYENIPSKTKIIIY